MPETLVRKLTACGFCVKATGTNQRANARGSKWNKGIDVLGGGKCRMPRSPIYAVLFCLLVDVPPADAQESPFGFSEQDPRLQASSDRQDQIETSPTKLPLPITQPESNPAAMHPIQFRRSEPQSVSGDSEHSANGRKPVRLSPPVPRQESTSPPAARRPSPIGSVITIVSSLAIVLGLFFVVVWVSRRGANRAGRLLSNEVVQILGRSPLAGRQQMHLIRIGHKLLLVSVTPTGAETLTEIDEPDEVQRLSALCEQHSADGISASFHDVFSQLSKERAPQGFLENPVRDDEESVIKG